MNHKIRIRLMYEGAQVPKQAHDGEWADIFLPNTMELNAGDAALLPLGIAMEVPEGYEAIMAPRSSTFKRYGLTQTNSFGVFDEKYNGSEDQWFFPCKCERDVVIPAGERICQFRIQKVQGNLEFEVVDDLGNTNRGGLGSTNKN